MFENDNPNVKYKLLNLLVDNPSFVLLLKNKYIDDDIWQFCIEREPGLFKHMKNPSIAICEFALEVDGYNLKYIAKKFKHIEITRKMVYIALRNCPKAIDYVPEDILDVGLRELAFDNDPSLMKDYDFKDLRYDYVSSMINKNPAYIKYINNPPDELIVSAIKQDSNVCVYFEKLSPYVINVVNELYPNLLELYSYNPE